jgi:glutamate N-acetyltransferase/amino-acid N-acetyltransferase
VSITTPKGFRAAGVAAGLKASGKPDVAVVINDGPRRDAAAVFTSNRVKAAPVIYSQHVLERGQVAAVVLNSGGANACTGPSGYADTVATAKFAASLFGADAGQVAICSTGLIGEPLPMHLLLPGVEFAIQTATANGGARAATAIMTTDTVPKQAVAYGDGWCIGGMAKGAGMLAPGLATMLVVLTTDAVLDSSVLDSALRAATSQTFDRVDSDGCMSTNDTVLLLASGASGISPERAAFTQALLQVCGDLAAQLISDAEGATKTIAVEVINAATESEAVGVARTVARSNLLKCAIHGEDPNWGRVLAAVGTTDAAFHPDSLSVAINGVWVCKNGGVGEERSTVDLSGRDVTITVDLAAGISHATVWTNDLTPMYVHENSAYST